MNGTPLLLLLAAAKHLLLERHAAAQATGARPVLALERLREHLARFEWPGEDELATNVTTREALGAYCNLMSPLSNSRRTA